MQLLFIIQPALKLVVVARVIGAGDEQLVP
jgi:hypothetical protein